MSETKICLACGEIKTLEAFNKAQSKVDGSPRWQSQCKSCKAKWCKENSSHMNAGARARRAKNPEKQKEKDRATYQRRREEELERGRRRRQDEHYINRVFEWRLSNIDYLRAYDANRNILPDRKAEMALASKRFCEQRPDRVLELAALYRKRHWLRLRQKRITRQIDNRDALNAALRERKKRERDRYRAYAHNRRARLKGNGGKHTHKDIARIRVEQNDRCAFCKIPLCGRGEVDHIVPPGYGGTNDPWNIQLTCDGSESCNRKKCATHPIIFLLRIRAGLVILRSPPAKSRKEKA